MRMRPLMPLACVLVLQSCTRSAVTYAASQNAVADHARHRWSRHPEVEVIPADRLNESEFAWVVQTGRESAEEAVAAIMVTFLQQAASHAGFVAGAIAS